MRFVLQPLLVGDEIGLHHAGAFHDGLGGFAHLGDELFDALLVFDKLGKRLAIALQQRIDLSQNRADRFVARGNCLDGIVEDAQPAQCAGRSRTIAADHEIVGEDLDRLKLSGDVLRLEFDCLQSGLGRVAREIVELVFHGHFAARERVLDKVLTLFLDLQDLGKDPGEGAEFALQLGDLVEPGRMGGVFRRLEDRILQAGFGRERRLAVLFLARARGRRSARGRCCAPDRPPSRFAGRRRRPPKRARSRDRQTPCWRPRSPASRQSRA
jgi:hypothetical protein